MIRSTYIIYLFIRYGSNWSENKTRVRNKVIRYDFT
jgi:hypothetical protein